MNFVEEWINWISRDYDELVDRKYIPSTVDITIVHLCLYGFENASKREVWEKFWHGVTTQEKAQEHINWLRTQKGIACERLSTALQNLMNRFVEVRSR